MKELYWEVISGMEKNEIDWCYYGLIDQIEKEVRFNNNMRVVDLNVEKEKLKVRELSQKVEIRDYQVQLLFSITQCIVQCTDCTYLVVDCIGLE